MRQEQGWRRRVLVVAVAAALLTSGCWLQVGNGPEHAYFNPGERTLTRANVASLAPEWTGHTDGELHSEPIVNGNRVYVSYNRSFVSIPPGGPIVARAGVMAMDADTGERVWGVDISPNMSSELLAGMVEPSQVVVVGDELWVSYYGETTTGETCAGALVRRDANTGANLGTVYSGRASAVVHFDGKVAWTRQALTPAGSCASTATPQLVVQDAATLTTLWTAPAGTVDIPAVIGDAILVAGTAYPAAGCGAAICSALWSADVPTPVHAQAGSPDGHVFLTAGPLGDVDIYSVDPTDGGALWSVPGSLGAFDGGVAIAAGLMYASVTDGAGMHLRAYPVEGCGAATCEPAWAARVPIEASYSRPVVAGGVVYAAAEFRLTAFDAAGCGAPTCEPLTWLNVVGGPTSVAAGKVLVSTRPYVGVPRVQTFAAG
jgi:outer membrane protein assembly factor BamB